MTSILSGILISCSTTRQSTAAYSYEPKMEQSSSDLLLASNNDKYYDVERVDKKILFSAYLSLTVEIPDTANSHIEKIAKKYNGYINEIGTYRTIIRVKSENLNDAIKEVSELGKVLNKNI